MGHPCSSILGTHPACSPPCNCACKSRCQGLKQPLLHRTGAVPHQGSLELQRQANGVDVQTGDAKMLGCFLHFGTRLVDLRLVCLAFAAHALLDAETRHTPFASAICPLICMIFLSWALKFV